MTTVTPPTNEQIAEAAKKQAGEDADKRKKTNQEQAAKLAKMRPTPTQLENDEFAHGAAFPTHEDDGSGPDPHVTRNMEARPRGGYTTRESRPRE